MVKTQVGLVTEREVERYTQKPWATVVEDWVLIQATPWWADEFSCYAINVMTQRDWRVAQHLIAEEESIELYIGTNETEEMTSLQYLKCLEIKSISEHQAKTVIWCLSGERSPGMDVGVLDVVKNIIWDEDGEEQIEITTAIRGFIEATGLTWE